MLKSDTIWNKLKQVHKNVYVMGLVSFFIQFGASIIYTTAASLTDKFMTGSTLLMVQSLSESTGQIIKIIPGIISDYFNNRKSLLMISYGAMVIVKVIFFVCILLSNQVDGGQSKFMSYILYTYVTTYFIDRIMSYVRDSPQASLLLESIEQSNKKYIEDGNVAVAEGNVIFSFGIRKAIASLGSIVGAILAYIFVKFNLLTGTQIYILAILPVIVGNIVLYYGVYDITNDRFDSIKSTNDENIINASVSDITNNKVVHDTLQEKLTHTISNIIQWCDNRFNVISSIYLILSTILAYKYNSNKTQIILFMIFNFILSFNNVNMIFIVLKLLLLLGLVYGYGLWAFLGLIIGIYVKDTIQEALQSVNISSLFLILQFMNINVIYKALLYVGSLLLIHSSYGYIALLLISIGKIIEEYYIDYLPSYTTSALLVLCHIKIFMLTHHIWTYLMYTAITTLSIYSTTGYMFFIIPNQVVELVKIIGSALIPYQFMFYLSIIIKNYYSYMQGGFTSIVTWILPKVTNHIPKIGNNISKTITISNNTFISHVGNSFQLYELIKLITNNTLSFISLLIIIAIVFIFIFTVPMSSPMLKGILCISVGVAMYGLLLFVKDTPLLQKCLQYKESLPPFIYTALTLMFLHVSRFNDGAFFKHGYTYIKALTKAEVPLMFMFLYIMIIAGSMLLSSLKKRKSLLFILAVVTLILSNIFLMSHTLWSFILSLICLGIYSSCTDILFISMIKQVIPKNNEVNGTFLGIYYLCMSISSIINAILSLGANDNTSVILNIYRSICRPLYRFGSNNPAYLSSMINLLFTIFPIISLGIWYIYIYKSDSVKDLKK